MQPPVELTVGCPAPLLGQSVEPIGRQLDDVVGQLVGRRAAMTLERFDDVALRRRNGRLTVVHGEILPTFPYFAR